MKTPHQSLCWRHAFCVLLLTSVAAVSPAIAQVSTCDALTLYGNAYNEKLCKSLSPTTQNHWVCALTDGTRDIHTTFNALTLLHLTVRDNPSPPGCTGNSTLGGTWPGNLVIGMGQPAVVCGVNVQNWVDRLNAVNRLPANGQTFCRAGFLAALANGADPALMQTYLNTCAAQACP
ncbi:MAG: hypothetical protein MEQ07_06950 [Aquimonas sp.]|nr:hypothetical protein [Aquimonas sp.]